MLKSFLFILFCENDADFHQIATFISLLAVYSRHTFLFLDLTYSFRTLFYNTFDKTLCFVVTCWERADLLALVCGVFCEFVTFPSVSWVRCGT